MALVYLSPRLLSNFPFAFTGSTTDRIDISIRGNNMSIESLNKKNFIKPSIAPFNSLSERPFLGNKNNIPGPGRYDNESTINKPKLYYLDEPYSLSKSLRFQKSKNNSLGPGTYFALNKFQFKKTNNCSIIKFHPSYNTNLEKRIRSIPSKDNQYGYSINDKGDLTIIEDPNKFSMHDGKKRDSVGPDQYQKLLKKDNHAIEWKRESAGMTKVIFHNKNNSFSDKNSYEYKNNSSPINNVTKANQQKDFFDYIIKHRNELLGFTEKRHNSVVKDKYNLQVISKIEKEHQMMECSDDNQIRTSQTRAERYQFFGSSSDRSLINTKENNSTPGPGTYFQLSKKKIKKIIPRYHSNIRQRNISYIPIMDCNLGTGSNDITSSSSSHFDQMNYHKIHFSSSQKRFPEVNSIEVGPGSYGIASLFDKKPQEYKLRPLLAYDRNYRKLNQSISQSLIDSKMVNESREYNHDIYDSFNYPLKKQMKKIKSRLIPFAPKSKRFDYRINRKNNNSLGSISYLKDNSNFAYIPKVNKVPFLSSKARDGILDSSNNISNGGPGEYYRDSYFLHVKKSFNLRYV